jgi:hypothetical protein
MFPSVYPRAADGTSVCDRAGGGMPTARTCQGKMMPMSFAGKDRHRIPIRRTPERIRNGWATKTVGGVHIRTAVAALCEVVVQGHNRRQVLILHLRRAPILMPGASGRAHHDYSEPVAAIQPDKSRASCRC